MGHGTLLYGDLLYGGVLCAVWYQGVTQRCCCSSLLLFVILVYTKKLHNYTVSNWEHNKLQPNRYGPPLLHGHCYSSASSGVVGALVLLLPYDAIQQYEPANSKREAGNLEQIDR